MSIGVHFSLTNSDLEKLLAFEDEEERRDFLSDSLEEEYFVNQREWLAESDKAWDAIHRVLTDGDLAWDNGSFPLNHVILGGQSLYSGDDYIMSLKSAEQVDSIAEALKLVTQESLRKSFFAIDPDEFDAKICDDEFESTWEYFEEIRNLFVRASEAKRTVIFTADQ